MTPYIDLSIILRDGKGYDPEFVWFYDNDIKYRGFYGDGEHGDCIAINFAGKLFSYATHKDNIHGTVLMLDYLVLHELAHWAENQGDDNHCQLWIKFLMNLLITLK